MMTLTCLLLHPLFRLRLWLLWIPITEHKTPPVAAGLGQKEEDADPPADLPAAAADSMKIPLKRLVHPRLDSQANYLCLGLTFVLNPLSVCPTSSTGRGNRDQFLE